MLRYLRFVGTEKLLRLPVTLRKVLNGEDPPDFVLDWPDGTKEDFEITEGSTQEHQKHLSAVSESRVGKARPIDFNTSQRGAEEQWAEILFSAFLKKAEGLRQGQFDLDHLLIYDLTGLRLLVPLENGAPILKRKLVEWSSREQPKFGFARISVLRDLALLLDVQDNSARLLRGGSPHFQIPAFRAHDEEDLKRRLRAIDRYCREHSIRHLKAFGSVLEDRVDLETGSLNFRDDSDLDLLVEFEPGTPVTLFDMARMERELGEIIGYKVDLRTSGDLSRYFRQEVLDKAVELPHVS